jgi:hypothetical protein
MRTSSRRGIAEAAERFDPLARDPGKIAAVDER